MLEKYLYEEQPRLGGSLPQCISLLFCLLELLLTDKMLEDIQLVYTKEETATRVSRVSRKPRVREQRRRFRRAYACPSSHWSVATILLYLLYSFNLPRTRSSPRWAKSHHSPSHRPQIHALLTPRHRNSYLSSSHQQNVLRNLQDY